MRICAHLCTFVCLPVFVYLCVLLYADVSLCAHLWALPFFSVLHFFVTHLYTDVDFREVLCLFVNLMCTVAHEWLQWIANRSMATLP